MRAFLLFCLVGCTRSFQRLPPPSTTAVTPHLSPDVGVVGDSIVLLNADSPATATFGGVEITFTADATGALTSTLPNTVTPNRYAVDIATPGGHVQQDFLVLEAAPQIVRVSNDSGTNAGLPSDRLTLTGSNFDFRNAANNRVSFSLAGVTGETTAQSATATSLVAQPPDAIAQAMSQAGGTLLVSVQIQGTALVTPQASYGILAEPRLLGMLPPRPSPGQRIVLFTSAGLDLLVGCAPGETTAVPSCLAKLSALTLRADDRALDPPAWVDPADFPGAPSGARAAFLVTLPNPLQQVGAARLTASNNRLTSTQDIPTSRGGDLLSALNGGIDLSAAPTPGSDLLHVPVETPVPQSMVRYEPLNRRISFFDGSTSTPLVRNLAGNGNAMCLSQADVRSTNPYDLGTGAGPVYGTFFCRSSEEGALIRLDRRSAPQARPGKEYGRLVRMRVSAPGLPPAFRMVYLAHSGASPFVLSAIDPADGSVLASLALGVNDSIQTRVSESGDTGLRILDTLGDNSALVMFATNADIVGTFLRFDPLGSVFSFDTIARIPQPPVFDAPNMDVFMFDDGSPADGHGAMLLGYQTSTALGRACTVGDNYRLVAWTLNLANLGASTPIYAEVPFACNATEKGGSACASNSGQWLSCEQASRWQRPFILSQLGGQPDVLVVQTSTLDSTGSEHPSVFQIPFSGFTLPLLTDGTAPGGVSFAPTTPFRWLDVSGKISAALPISLDASVDGRGIAFTPQVTGYDTSPPNEGQARVYAAAGVPTFYSSSRSQLDMLLPTAGAFPLTPVTLPLGQQSDVRAGYGQLLATTAQFTLSLTQLATGSPSVSTFPHASVISADELLVDDDGVLPAMLLHMGAPDSWGARCNNAATCDDADYELFDLTGACAHASGSGHVDLGLDIPISAYGTSNRYGLRTRRVAVEPGLRGLIASGPSGLTMRPLTVDASTSCQSMSFSASTLTVGPQALGLPADAQATRVLSFGDRQQLVVLWRRCQGGKLARNVSLVRYDGSTLVGTQPLDLGVSDTDCADLDLRHPVRDDASVLRDVLAVQFQRDGTTATLVEIPIAVSAFATSGSADLVADVSSWRTTALPIGNVGLAATPLGSAPVSRCALSLAAAGDTLVQRFSNGFLQCESADATNATINGTRLFSLGLLAPLATQDLPLTGVNLSLPQPEDGPSVFGHLFGVDLWASRRAAHTVVAGAGDDGIASLYVYALDGGEANLRSVIRDDSQVVSAAAFRSGEALVVRTARSVKLYR